MQRFFEEPVMDVLEFFVEDILTTSPGGDFSNTGNPFEGDDDVFEDGDYSAFF